MYACMITAVVNTGDTTNGLYDASEPGERD
jgi:hypothetical protein